MEKISYIILTFLLLIIQCHRQIISPVQENKSGKISMTMTMSNAPSEVKNISGYLSRASYDTIFFKFTISNNTASALVENIIQGNWKLTVNAYDSTGFIIYSGWTNVNVIPGIINTVSLHLNPVTGTLEIIVTWGNYNYLDSLLIVYYPFDGNANDASGNNNHGIIYGAQLTSDRFGNPNSAYYFDGVDDYIQTSSNIILRDSITWSAWLKTDTLKQQTIIGNWSGGGGDGWQLFLRSNIYSHGTITLESPNNIFYESNQELTLNEWVNIFVTIDGSVVKIYINGDLDSSYPQLYPLMNGYQTRIGDLYHPNPWNFSGCLDEIRIYKRSLLPDEIHQLYLSTANKYN